ncbi:UDP-2,4-diacetamido-2,4,6-trideoxy-beta-L-altropyranose hydrolase [Gallaecimonas mangrovi]|uniref:UDP-2,4-diacetamido-2,4, 6-trideoxy-beta-L-altropyranose hydrolase n=1 Tax=Gallaecimonas mangrovi TaxID=2291597 RepID=UPI000E2094C3|nr:UDP-2,4-diacetamido-2,4,6-trideoxy-beta-L-altropyranose hydrolase [Gallaecimonas mangrovi]
MSSPANLWPMLVVRTDSSHRIGLGHLSRCLTIARAWPGPVRFICRDLPGAALHWLDEMPVNWLPAADDDGSWLTLPPLEDAKQCLDVLAEIEPQPAILLVDHYGLNKQWQQAILQQYPALKLVCIDDLCRAHSCDLLIDTSLGRTPKDYALPAWGKYFLGPAFVPLRPEFKPRAECGEPHQLLMSLGGIDANNDNLRLLEWLDSRAKTQGITVTLAISRQAPHLEALQAFAKAHPWLTLAIDSQQMGNLMRQARLAIGAAGTSAWERCACGLPTLQLVVADNQRHNAESLASAGVAINIDGQDKNAFLAAFDELWQSQTLRKKMRQAALSLCDGQGTWRIIDALKTLTQKAVRLRPMTEDDCQRLYRWQCEAGARTYSRNSAIPDWSEHQAWFHRTLAAKGTKLWCIEQAQLPLGMLRLDWQSDDKAEVSILLSAQARGKGLGLEALIQLQRMAWVTTLVAEVHPDNLASQKLFLKAGFHATGPRHYEVTP